MRLADIAEEAGVHSASVLYYYPDVQELFAEVFAKGSAQYAEQRESQVARARTSRERLEACISSGIPWPGAPEEASRILYELIPVVLRHAKAAEQYERFVDRQAALYERILDEGQRSGDFRLVLPAPVLARSFVALEDGYGVSVLTGTMSAEQEKEWLLQYARTVAPGARDDAGSADFTGS
ncbi:hypothetical protein GCM10011512_29460 [Tersicoccus solisilvae]|uniref:HTH tetR-type domain-containing protein n=2 Tax=Tersicoccus solisilvae TaxID=1882339 RepID=A0ABQ1PPS6_9MICC|nr:hypothetical protein GCM10011512_29460 [Tersicoccus solisilvae]